MLVNRRHLRIKVLHALYSYYQPEEQDILKSEKELVFSVEKMYDLYIYLLTIFPELKHLAEQKIEEGKEKRLPSKEDLDPNLKFANNRVLSHFALNRSLRSVSEKKKINWMKDRDLILKLFNQIRVSEEYAEYMSDRDNDLTGDKRFIVSIFKKYIVNSELLQHFFDEKSIFWVDDLDLVASIVIKHIKQIDENTDEFTPIFPLYKDKKDEKDFMIKLFRETVRNDEENEALIDKHTSNWELDRIAKMDIILMKMALTEASIFPSIPIKVTLNEYIDISKFYSTPKSSVFINGVLDKAFAEMKSKGRIKKVGRGLIE